MIVVIPFLNASSNECRGDEKPGTFSANFTY